MLVCPQHPLKMPEYPTLNHLQMAYPPILYCLSTNGHEKRYPVWSARYNPIFIPAHGLLREPQDAQVVRGPRGQFLDMGLYRAE